jgi:hypothetical protein
MELRLQHSSELRAWSGAALQSKKAPEKLRSLELAATLQQALTTQQASSGACVAAKRLPG